MFNWLKKILPVPEGAARGGPSDSASIADLQNECSAHRKRGNEFLAQGRLEEAAECYRQAVAANPHYADGFLNLGFVSRELRHYEDAEHYLQLAVRIDPTLADAYYLLGSLAQENGNLAEAIEYFSKTLELKPDFEIVYGDLYQMLFQNRQYENAKKVIQQGLSLFPQSAKFHCCLGKLYVGEKEFEQAITC